MGDDGDEPMNLLDVVLLCSLLAVSWVLVVLVAAAAGAYVGWW